MAIKINFILFITLVLLIALPWHAFGSVSADYIPESSITLNISPGPFSHSSVLGAKLGTFIITSTTGVIYSPSFVDIGEASDATHLTGLMKDYTNGPFALNTNDFYIISVAYPNGYGGTPVLQVLYNNVRPIIEWKANTVTQNPFYVELYFVNTNSTNPNAQSGWRKAQYFKLDSPFSLPSNFNPIFSVAVADSPNTNVGTYTSGDIVNEAEGSYVVTNGNDGPNNTPIISPCGYTNPENPGSPGFYYGDVPVLPSVFFNIVDSLTSFTLESAYGTNKVTVTQAHVEVINGVSGDEYEITLIFTDTSSDSSFQLFPSQGIGRPIDYKLFLGDDEVTKAFPLDWTELLPGITNSKDIRISGIKSVDVASNVSGDYEGTITVNITNLD
ncbi:MAG: hypothetical protein JEY71_02885 [Sphaerochaeta sp.]|nr:hypothetical protein [Sphaerochaeta sp.]